jgi:two-component sensor histidine kinase
MKIERSTQCDDRETTQTLLVGELQHRIRNLVTMVQYLVVRTQGNSVTEYRSALKSRIDNLADAYELVEGGSGFPVSLAKVLERTLRPYTGVQCDRIRAMGPDIELETRLGLALHLIFHELATNACKHGALASSSGQVMISWDVELGDLNQRLVIQWAESGGPEVREPWHTGFGLNLITKILPGANVKMKFEGSGLICGISCGISNCAQA